MILPVAAIDLGQDRVVIYLMARLAELFTPPLRANLGVRLHEYLHVGVWKDNCSDVTAIENDASSVGLSLQSNPPLLGNHLLADVWPGTDATGGLAGLRRSDLPCDVVSIQKNPLPAIVIRNFNAKLGQNAARRLVAVKRATPQHTEPEGPVHRAGIQIDETEPLGNKARGSTFAGAGRPIDSNNHEANRKFLQSAMLLLPRIRFKDIGDPSLKSRRISAQRQNRSRCRG